ncbi:MAG: GFA family protein [Xanthomonadaceae bacterium]|nr:GFA family protein [Xanthomonadaceae bacterium]
MSNRSEAFLSIDCGAKVVFDGPENIAVYASSPWAERGFCRQCGTHLFYRLTGHGQHFIPAGVFDDIPGVTFEHQIFIDRKPPYYEFANGTQNLTEADVQALHADEG